MNNRVGLDDATLNDVIAVSAKIGCPYYEEREEFRQEIWFGLLEGRLEVFELLDRRTLRKFWRDTWKRPTSRKRRHKSFDAIVTRDGSLRYSEIIDAEEAQYRIAGG